MVQGRLFRDHACCERTRSRLSTYDRLLQVVRKGEPHKVVPEKEYFLSTIVLCHMVDVSRMRRDGFAGQLRMSLKHILAHRVQRLWIAVDEIH